MKTTLALCLGLFALAPLSAQVLRPQAVNGALLGGVAGAVIGHNSGDLRHNAWRGAAIGAATGLVLGDAVGYASAGGRNRQIGGSGAYIYRDSPVVYAGYRSGYRSPGHGYAGHGYSTVRRHYGNGGYGGVSLGYYPGYDYGAYPYGNYGYYGSGSAAAGGLWLGALAGGIIGHNSGEFRHNGWRGAAWGAGAGWLLGTVLDANRRAVAYESPMVVQQAPVVQTPAAPAAQPQNVTIINNYYNAPATPMSSANTLFGRN
jgi:hypothetical protein